MRRFGQVIGVDPARYQEYVAAHADVWPGVLARIADCNIRDYSIYAFGELLFATFEYHGEDFDADMRRMADDPETQRWWAYVMPMQRPLEGRGDGEWWATMTEVFHVD